MNHKISFSSWILSNCNQKYQRFIFFTLVFLFGRNRIISFSSPGMTFWNSFCCKQNPLYRAMNFNSLNSIFRARRYVSAWCRCKRGDCIFIEINRQEQNPTQNSHYHFSNLLHFLLFCHKIKTNFESYLFEGPVFKIFCHSKKDVRQQFKG